MTNPIINGLYKSLEDIKDEANNGLPYTLALIKAEKLLNIAKQIKKEYAEISNCEQYIKELEVLITNIQTYMDDLASLTNLPSNL